MASMTLDGDAVACLLIGLRVGLDGEDAVDLPLIEALESQALAGHQTPDASAAFHDTLNTTCLQRVGDIAPDAPAAGLLPANPDPPLSPG